MSLCRTGTQYPPEDGLRYAFATTGSTIIGFGQGWLISETTYLIDLIYVMPDYRKKGVARDLIWSLISYAMSIPEVVLVKGITQMGNEAAKELLLDIGFNAACQ
jgi:GNAT superfamily N-acetyltransferase